MIINADRVLACQIAFESFKAISGWRVQGLKKFGGIHHDQLSAGYLGEICRKPLRKPALLKDSLGEFSAETPIMDSNVSH
jgi:hypothetical protein